MGLLQRKTKLGALIETVGAAQLPAAVGSALSGRPAAEGGQVRADGRRRAHGGQRRLSALRKRSENAERDR